MSAPPVLVLDSASLYYRAFHALPESMTAPDGHPHNAIRGFLSTLTRLVTAHRPARVVAAWDEDWRPDWRVALVPTYKSHRVADVDAGTEESPETLGPQVEGLAALLDALGIPRVGVAGFEADDVIGSVCAQAGRPVVVVSGDRDLVQVVRDETRLLLTVNGGMDKWPLLDPAGVIERFGVPPQGYVDMAVLRGDPSDGLPGVPGIGAKTAVALIAGFGDLETVLAAARAGRTAKPLTPRLATLLLEHESGARAAQQVARVRTDLTGTDPAALDRRSAPDPLAASQLATDWGVTRQVAGLNRALGQTADE